MGKGASENKFKAPLLLEVEIFENQRRYPLSGWGTKMLPTDRCSWSSRDGSVERTKNEIEHEIPDVYKWTSDWEVEKRDGVTDAEGWSYAFDFPAQYYPEQSFNRHVRRRRWVRRASRPVTSGDAPDIIVSRKFAEHSMVYVGDPEFDLVDEAEVRHLERQSRMSIAPQSKWQDEKTVRQCNACKTEFSVMKRKHHCRFCGLVYCAACCEVNAEFSNVRVCKPCIDAEAARLAQEKKDEQERREREAAERAARMAWEASVKANFELEESTRREIESQRDSQMVRLEAVRKAERDAAKNAEKQRVEAAAAVVVKSTKDVIKDKWAAIKGKRAGSLSITVVRAKGLVPRRPFLTVDARPMIYNPSAKKEYRGPVVYGTVTPEFDFEEYFAVEDDRFPILVTIVENRTGGTVCIGKLDLRFPYPNIIKEVSSEDVFTEFGHIEMDVYNKDGEVYPSTTITVKWKFEARTMETTKFCGDCGSVEHRCKCTPEVVEQRRLREQLAMMQQQAAEAEAREMREAAERAEAEKRAAEEAEWRRSELVRLLDGNDFEEREARRGVAEHETKQRLWILDQSQAGIAKLRRAAVREVALRNALLEMARITASAEQSLRGHALGVWHLFAANRKAERETAAEKAKVAAAMREEMSEAQKQAAAAEAERKKRDEEERKRLEMQRYDEGKNEFKNITRDHEGAPRPVEHKDTRAPVANVDKRGCCAAM